MALTATQERKLTVVVAARERRDRAEQELHAAIREAAEIGVPATKLAPAAGVHRVSVGRWLAKDDDTTGGA
jgi:hypothetical protein